MFKIIENVITLFNDLQYNTKHTNTFFIFGFVGVKYIFGFCMT